MLNTHYLHDYKVKFYDFYQGRLSEYLIKNNRHNFLAIAEELMSDYPIYIMKNNEKPITLKDIIDLGMYCHKEIGVYIETDSHRVFLSGGVAKAATSAMQPSLIRSPLTNYYMIAHCHATYSGDSHQLENDIEQKKKEQDGEKLEVVITANHDLLFYNERGYFPYRWLNESVAMDGENRLIDGITIHSAMTMRLAETLTKLAPNQTNFFINGNNVLDNNISQIS